MRARGGDVIAKAASRLGQTVEMARTLFERLAEAVKAPLTFA